MVENTFNIPVLYYFIVNFIINSAERYWIVLIYIGIKYLHNCITISNYKREKNYKVFKTIWINQSYD